MARLKLIPARTLPAAVLLGAATALSACSSTTYGTGTPADQQLLEDLTGVLSLGGDRREPIAYQPRGELVRPASTASLPAPQQSATASGGAWPESPEQRLARVRADATGRQDSNFEPELRSGRSTAPTSMTPAPRSHELGGMGAANQVALTRGEREAFNRQLAQSRASDPNSRRFLSEPPPAFRQPAASAPVGDVGEDEWRKERAQRAAQGRSSWRNWLPGS